MWTRELMGGGRDGWLRKEREQMESIDESGKNREEKDEAVREELLVQEIVDV